MSRRRLPNRRPSDLVTITHDGLPYSVSIGRDPETGAPMECFIHANKPDSDIDRLLDDAGVLLSLALQHGVTPADLQPSMGRINTTGRASVIGAVVDALAQERPQPVRGGG